MFVCGLRWDMDGGGTLVRAAAIHKFLANDPALADALAEALTSSSSAAAGASSATPHASTLLPDTSTIDEWRSTCWSEMADFPWMADYANL